MLHVWSKQNKLIQTGALTFKSELRLLILSVWAGLMTMPVTCVVPLVTAVVVLSMVAHCCPFTMCTW